MWAYSLARNDEERRMSPIYRCLSEQAEALDAWRRTGDPLALTHGACRLGSGAAVD